MPARADAATPPYVGIAAPPADLVLDPADGSTMILAAIRPAVPPVEKPALRRPSARDRVVTLRAEPTELGYRSIYARLTRTGTRSVLRGIARAATDVLVTLGVVAVLFAGYEMWGTPLLVTAHQKTLEQQLEQEWAGTPADVPTVGPTAGAPGASARPLPPPPGYALARLYIPRLHKFWVVVEGVQPNDLRFAPGHYPGTARPGQIGNFAVAGHRNTATFWDLDQMHDGDPIVVETARTWFVYRVTRVHAVAPSAVEVVAPVPGRPGVRPTLAMLTLTTCTPKFSNAQRLIVHAQLAREQPRSTGRPAEIGPV